MKKSSGCRLRRGKRPREDSFICFFLLKNKIEIVFFFRIENCSEEIKTKRQTDQMMAKGQSSKRHSKRLKSVEDFCHLTIGIFVERRCFFLLRLKQNEINEQTRRGHFGD